jgi:hypothetical protein
MLTQYTRVRGVLHTLHYLTCNFDAFLFNFYEILFLKVTIGEHFKFGVLLVHIDHVMSYIVNLIDILRLSKCYFCFVPDETITTPNYREPFFKFNKNKVVTIKPIIERNNTMANKGQNYENIKPTILSGM